MARVMVVDDAGFMRQTLKAILAKHGHEIVGEAANGHEAIRLYAQLQPDLVTMDVTMPELDGVGAIKGIREIDGKARIVVVSAIGQQARVIDAIHAGASDYVIKPFEEDRLLTAIKVALAR